MAGWRSKQDYSTYITELLVAELRRVLKHASSVRLVLKRPKVADHPCFDSEQAMEAM